MFVGGESVKQGKGTWLLDIVLFFFKKIRKNQIYIMISSVMTVFVVQCSGMRGGLFCFARCTLRQSRKNKSSSMIEI